VNLILQANNSLELLCWMRESRSGHQAFENALAIRDNTMSDVPSCEATTDLANMKKLKICPQTLPRATLLSRCQYVAGKALQNLGRKQDA
jgi:hypothetical protein